MEIEQKILENSVSLVKTTPAKSLRLVVETRQTDPMKKIFLESETAQHPLTDAPAKIVIQDMNFYYGTVQALKCVNMTVPANKERHLSDPQAVGNRPSCDA